MRRTFYKNVELTVLRNVYDPREDSFLLADHVDAEKGHKVLDLGCGSGLISIIAANQGAEVTASDVNITALDNTIRNMKKHGHKVKAIQSDLFSEFKARETFDRIFFNPPYVISEKIGELDRSTDGGALGRELIDKFIDNLPKYLKPRGKAMLVNSSQNGVELTKLRLTKRGLKWRIVKEKPLFFEKLFLFEINK
ncbi:MAG: HemK2/MTQ2 family protein methyltransferase [Candidatus Micrarchaeota archaeon]